MPMLLQSFQALIEGFGLALSPCILPVLPLILAGGATGDRRKPYGIILGFILSFTVFSLLSRQLLGALGVGEDTVRTVSYALLGLMGIVILVPVLNEKFSVLTQGLAARAQNVKTGEGFCGGVTLGLLIGLVWTPCAGPILGPALAQVIQARTSAEAALTIFLFSLGAAGPMLAVVLTGKAMVQKFAPHTALIRNVIGVIFILFAGLGFAGVNVGALATGVVASAPIADSEGLKGGIEKPYAAPGFDGAVKWINSEPLKLADLKGKVVLVDFWTYSCINCLRTLPYLRDWHEKYHDKGLVIIGVHAPEFAFEGKPENVAAAVKKYDVKWPVAMDNNFRVWDAYGNRFWPAHYLIDREGRVVYTHFGEGHYDVTEHDIRHLLGLKGAEKLDSGKDVTSDMQTPETYLGTGRAENEQTGSGAPPLHHWKLAGAWKRNREMITAGDGGDTLTLHFHAQKVFLVMGASGGGTVDVEVTGSGTAADVKNGRVKVGQPRAYEIARLPQAGEGTVTIKVPGAGLSAYAFTFESDPK
jgi:cytochrome c biogenesis protein CcdA/thiol-disulfide isomerase/thioredoxin